MVISMIAAMGQNRVIGCKGGLPWHIPGELNLFKQKTMGKPIVMGRKTWESLGGILPGRPHIVITRDRSYQAEGVHVANDIDYALSLASQLASSVKETEVMIIGGAEIYSLTMEKADRLYLTEVALRPEGDAYFPNFDISLWPEISRTIFESKDGAPAYSFVVREAISEKR